MELWIRSQEKIGLTKVDLFKIVEINEKMFEIKGLLNGTILSLGTYKTKERALEVLDEIQKLLIGYINAEATGNQMNGILGTTYIKTCFYEMPKE